MNKRFPLVYGFLAAVWLLIVVWQVAEHRRIENAARTGLQRRAQASATALRDVIPALGWDTRRGLFIEQERLETGLKTLLTENGLTSIALLNAAGVVVVSAGAPIDPEAIGQMQGREHWGAKSLTVVRRVDLILGESSEGETNRPAIVVAGGPPRDRPPSPREGGPPTRPDFVPTNTPDFASDATHGGAEVGGANPPDFGPGDRGHGPPRGEPRRRGLPPWMMTEEERQKRGLHGLVVVMPTESIQEVVAQDLWVRLIISALGAVAVCGIGLAWRSVVRSSDLQIRLVRTSELNTHLKEMNLAAAGLAHETRNPLNIIRGVAQMISKQPEATPEVRTKSLEIINEADRVTAQLNEFINYSKPREVRRTAVALGSVVNEVVRALNYDLEEKHVHLQVSGDQVNILADEQLLRQALFNLLLNATQAVEAGGEIEVAVQKRNGAQALLEIRDNGPGVPEDRRTEIFKPYFTTHSKGTGLGLAVVHQIVLAHGWEVECLPNEPHGAIFRISHLKVAVPN